jgi:bifunctional ADP-heptose synthase (sugar kinase/adenylyltransferase)
MTLFQASKTTHLKSVAREVFDVTGAGDTVLAVIALSIACKGNIINSAKLGNHAGGVAVSKVGTATISLKELKSSFSKNDKKI